jgi:manganese transport protein
MEDGATGTETHQSSFGARVPTRQRGWLRRLFAFAGPAYLVSVGYMDPGNWATDIEGGARFGYALLWVLLMSNVMAVLLQTLSARLGLVTGYDLAQGCRREYPRPVTYLLWVMAEIAITATDLAEVLGTVVALNLLFGLPLLWGCLVAAFDTVLFLLLERLGIRKIEAFIVMLVATVGACFVIEIVLAKPEWGGIMRGFVPHLDPSALLVAIGIIGATVMPHNLYLHSALVQTRQVANTVTGKREACRFNLIDSAVALNAAFFVNAAILIMAAANFHRHGIVVNEIQQAHGLLDGVLGSKIAPIAFAVALLASGQSSTVTGTLSGQVVMEGFLNLRMRPWLRRLITRGLALVPAVVVILLAGDQSVFRLLILSQVILSLQLPFAVIPLVHFTSDRRKMGVFVSSIPVRVLGVLVAAIIVGLNLRLAYAVLSDWLKTAPGVVWILIVPVGLVVLGALGYVALRPFLRSGRPWESGIVTESTTVAAALRPQPIRHIGVALEHSPGDAAVLSAALSQAKAYGAKLTLVHVVETPGVMMLGKESASRHGSEDEVYLERLVREVEGRDLPVEYDLRVGRPSDEIVRAAEEDGFDMLILGSHGHRGLEDLVHGTTVSHVRHALRIPIMVVRSGTGERPQHADAAKEKT